MRHFLPALLLACLPLWGQAQSILPDDPIELFTFMLDFRTTLSQVIEAYPQQFRSIRPAQGTYRDGNFEYTTTACLPQGLSCSVSKNGINHSLFSYYCVWYETESYSQALEALKVLETLVHGGEYACGPLVSDVIDKPGTYQPKTLFWLPYQAPAAYQHLSIQLYIRKIPRLLDPTPNPHYYTVTLKVTSL